MVLWLIQGRRTEHCSPHSSSPTPSVLPFHVLGWGSCRTLWDATLGNSGARRVPEGDGQTHLKQHLTPLARLGLMGTQVHPLSYRLHSSIPAG